MSRRTPVALPTPRRAGAVALAAAALALAGGCTREQATATSGAGTLPPATASDAPSTTAGAAETAPPDVPVTAPVTAPASTVPAPPPTTLPLDAAVTLATALDSLAIGYHFVTTATVGGQVAVTAEGDHIAGSTQMTVASSGTTTQYLVTADAAWALADGSWQQLDSTQGLSDPVTQLRSPASVAISGTPEAATIVAQYPNAALGLAGDGQASVEFQLVGGQISSLRYASTAVVTNADGSTSEQPAEVTAVISPVAPGTQITLPAAEA